MYGTIATAALLGLSAVAQARPAAVQSGSTSSFPTMSSAAVQVASATGGVGAQSTGSVNSTSQKGAFKFPLANGFPNIQNPSAQLDKISQQAHGELSNAGAPKGLHDDTINSLTFVAFNELFEVAFFSELLQNVTLSKPGYGEEDLLGVDRETVLRNLEVILAQEELHELNANGAVNANIQKTVQPCTYDFPVDNFKDAITLASTFTDVVLGTLPDIQTVAATAGDAGAIRGVGAALGNEGEQNGFYRSILGKVPSQLPFLTGSARNFAFNAILQSFVVECPAATLDLLEKPAGGIPLNETGKLTPPMGLSIDADVIAEFSLQTVDPAGTKSYYENNKDQITSLTYINQQNVPLSVDIKDVTFANNAIIIKASFPGKSEFLNGLTIAAVTAGNKFTSVDDVASATLFGPGLIEIN